MRLRAPMPGDETEARPRGRAWLLAVLPIVAFAVWTLVQMPFAAEHPTGYAAHHMLGPWVYPTTEVAVCMSVLVLEALGVTALLAARSETPLGGRAFLLSILLGVGTFLFAPFAMHADSTIGGTLAWNGIAVIWLFTFALGTGIWTIGESAVQQVRLWLMTRRGRHT
jgi:hypothetical protein